MICRDTNHLSEFNEDSVETELRALREQISLNADTIRNLEQLLNIALEGSGCKRYPLYIVGNRNLKSIFTKLKSGL